MTSDIPPDPTYEEQERQALTQKLIGWFKQDIAHAAKWRMGAREDYAFYNGDQWAEDDAALLQRQKRPVMTFNRVAPLVNAVIGGMGWIDTRLDFESNADGDPVVQRLDPFKMVWDKGAVKANLSDAKRLWYVDDKPEEEVRALFPDLDPLALHADWAKDLTGTMFEGRDGDGADKKLCTLVECRWLEREEFFRGPDLVSGEAREYSKAEIDALLQEFPILSMCARRARLSVVPFWGGVC